MKTSKNSTKAKKIEFQVKADPTSKVFVCGSFNNWNPKQYPMKDNPNSGVFKTTIPLSEGRHEYKFVINGVWCPDPNCPESVENACGTVNSVITVC